MEFESLVHQSIYSRYTCWVGEALDQLPHNFTITDPSISGHPIVFASPGFLNMSGYSKQEVIGKNGRIFQGPNTDRASVVQIREAIRQERSIQITLLNYRRDGKPFWMLLHLTPFFSNEDGKLVHFVAVQLPIPPKFTTNATKRSRPDDDRSRRSDSTVFGSCRRAMCSDTIMEFGLLHTLNSVFDLDSRGFDGEESCQVSDAERQKAAAAVNSIFSVLNQYSELTGRLVCGKRCRSVAIGHLSSSLIISLGTIKQSFLLADVSLHDMPIVYASDAFLKLTGYTRQEVLGRNCRFLTGPDTDAKAIFQIKESIQCEQACSVRILNYRKDGYTFWNLLHISPVRNASGRIAFFVGVQIDEECTHKGSHGLSPKMRQLGTVGAVKVAVRSSSMGVGPSKS